LPIRKAEELRLAAVVYYFVDIFLPLPIQAFKSRVQVWSDVGRYLYRCHPEQARRLVLEGSAFSADKSPNGRIWKLILVSPLSFLSSSVKPPTPLSSFSYKGQQYIYREKVRCSGGRLTKTVCQFKKIHKQDRWAFVLSQTDAMS
jgi:hypothetical protein